MIPEETPLTGVFDDSAAQEHQSIQNHIDTSTENCDHKSTVNQQVVSEKTQDEVVIESTGSEVVPQALPNAQVIIGEIKEFLKNINTKLHLDQKARLKIFHLTRALQSIDFDASDFIKNIELKAQDLAAFKTFIDYVEDKCNELDLDTINESVQEEIAKLVVLLNRIESLIYSQPQNALMRKKLVILSSYLEIALVSLFQTEPNIILAQNIRIEIQHFVCKCEHPIWGGTINRFNQVQRSKSTPLKVLYGLLTAFLITLGVSAIIIIPLVSYLQFSTETSKHIREAEQERANILIEKQRLELQNQNNIIDSNNSDNSNRNNPSASIVTTSPDSSVIAGAAVVGQEVLNTISAKNAQIAHQLDTANKKLDQKEYELTLLKQQRSADLKTIDTIIQITLVIVAGTLGSIISILIRIEDFQDRKYQDPLVPFLLGAFKPIIGASFAIFFFTLLSSELLIIPTLQESPANQLVPSQGSSTSELSSISYQQLQTDRVASKKQFFIFAIAFVVGFSERIAKDAISKMEGTIGGNSENQQSRPKSIKVSRLRTSKQTTIQKETSQESNSSP